MKTYNEYEEQSTIVEIKRDYLSHRSRHDAALSTIVEIKRDYLSKLLAMLKQ